MKTYDDNRYQKAFQAAEKICDLMDSLGFTTENAVIPDELNGQIAAIILEQLEKNPDLLKCGTRPESALV